MIKISNEVLSEVLGINIDENDIYIKNNYCYYAYCRSDNEWVNASLNIYELAHKCKEWALKNGYYLRAEQGINYYDTLQWTCFLNKDMDDGADYVDYWNLTEVEAIIKACEWIYKELNK